MSGCPDAAVEVFSARVGIDGHPGILVKRTIQCHRFQRRASDRWVAFMMFCGSRICGMMPEVADEIHERHNHMDNKVITLIDSPMGELFLEQREGMLTRLHFVAEGEKPELEKSGNSDRPAFREVVSQLNAYFRGELREFNIPLLLEGTEFQKRAWKVLQAIPYGETISYGEQARRMGSPKAVRAVGGANHRNPVAIIVPCHRVIGKSGDLTGFGGGLAIKARLLALEKT